MVGLGLTWGFCWALGPLFAGKCSGAGPTASAITRLDGNANPGPPKLRGYMGGQKNARVYGQKLGEKAPYSPAVLVGGVNIPRKIPARTSGAESAPWLTTTHEIHQGLFAELPSQGFPSEGPPNPTTS